MRAYATPLLLEEGILVLDKPRGPSSFALVHRLRQLTHIRKIGHTGTLDPFATGVMVMLVGKSCTRLSDQLIADDKTYLASIHLGVSTDTYDGEGTILSTSEQRPSLEDVMRVLQGFQGEILQVPPMFSAKKVQGKKLYHLARQGIEIPRNPVPVRVALSLIEYAYPYLHLEVTCSKGTYIRSLAHDIGEQLGCGAHLSNLRRTRSGSFVLEQALPLEGLCLDSIRSHLIAPLQVQQGTL